VFYNKMMQFIAPGALLCFWYVFSGIHVGQRIWFLCSCNIPNIILGLQKLCEVDGWWHAQYAMKVNSWCCCLIISSFYLAIYICAGSVCILYYQHLYHDARRIKIRRHWVHYPRQPGYIQLGACIDYHGNLGVLVKAVNRIWCHKWQLGCIMV